MDNERTMYAVITATYDPESGESSEREELRRSEKHVADNDAYLFRTITGRRAWVETTR